MYPAKRKEGLIYVFNAIDVPSREFLTHIEAIENENKDSLIVNRIDTYKSNSIALKFGVDKVPAIVITRAGKIVDKLYDLDKDQVFKAL